MRAAMPSMPIIKPHHLVLCLQLALLAVLATACGGGGGGNPDPNPNYPDPVEELATADLDNAGVPALPLTASSVSALSSAGDPAAPLNVCSAGAENGAERGSSTAADCLRTETVDHNETITIHNLVPTSTGFVTDVPESATSRIIGWAMYQLPGNPGERMRSITIDADPAPGLRLFYAVGNFSAGRWEVGGRIAVDPSDATGITYFLSPGQSYNRSSDGAGYLLLLIGHPGTGNMDGLQIALTEVLISSFDVECLAEGFSEQAIGSIDWGDGALELTAQDGTSNTILITQQFAGTTFDDAAPQLLLAQPLALLGGPDSFFAFQQITGDWNGDGTDTIGFYDPREVNGPQHPYGIVVNGRDGNDEITVSAGSLLPTPGSSEPSAIIAVLIGLADNPAPEVPAQLINAQDLIVWQGATDARGRVVIEDANQLEPGVHTLRFNFGPQVLSYQLTLMEEEGIFYYLIQKA